MKHEHLVIYCDGGARGNPGPAAIGVVISAPHTVIHTISKTIGRATNNQAEYQAIHAGLDYALEHGAKKVEVYSDSELVVKQLQGKYRVKNNDLGPWYIKICSLANQIGEVTYNAVRREQNQSADRLVNQALDAAGQ